MFLSINGCTYPLPQTCGLLRNDMELANAGSEFLTQLCS